jgi:hypothetical protein
MRTPFLALALFTLAACGSDSTGPGGNPNGTYTLTTVDNKALPVAFADSTIQSGELVVTDAGWSQITVVRYVAGGSGSANGDTLTLAGAWATQGSDITLWDSGLNTQYTGTFTSKTMNLTTKTATVLSYSK